MQENKSRCFFSEKHHEDQRHRGARKTEPNQVESTDLSELLIPLFTVIIVHNTVTQRQFFSVFPFLQTNITSQM